MKLKSLAVLVVLVLAPAELRALDETGLHGTLFVTEIGPFTPESPARSVYVVEPRGGRRAFPTPWVFFFGGDFLEAGSMNEQYANALLDDGYVVTTFGIGVACGSEGCARLMEDFYAYAVGTYGLAPKMRILAQSNGGLGAYGYASRHPEHVDRIGGIYPAVDWRSWPGLGKLNCLGGCYADTMYTQEELDRPDDYDPINRLAPLAEHGIVIFHLHGDSDRTVPAGPNSLALRDLYRALGGTADVVLVPNQGHDPTGMFQETMVRFLKGLPPYPPMSRAAAPMVFLRPGSGGQKP